MSPEREAPIPDRAGSTWTREEDELLAEQLGTGQILEEIAASLHRSVGAIKGRACRMLPSRADMPSGPAAIPWLRERLVAGYEWQRQLYRHASLAHAGEPWTRAEYERLVDEIRSGLTWEDTAQTHGRTPDAIRARASLLVTETDDTLRSKAKRAEMLRALLADDPNYDWWTPLTNNLPAGQHLWSEAEDEALREAWQERTRLPDLAAAWDISELALVHHLIELELASTLVEVTDRLGFTDGGPVHRRRTFALDPANTLITVLVGWNEDGVDHVSVHLDVADANRTRQGVHPAQELHWETPTCSLGAGRYDPGPSANNPLGD
jgi:hypothetical protein